MIFSALYGAYYNAVADIVKLALNGELDQSRIIEIINKRAFNESCLSIPKAINERWQLITSDMKTPLKHEPTMPLTLLEKRWLKAISLDKRIKLFGVDFSGIEDNVTALFTPQDIVIFDVCSDGDPYDDEKYVENFTAILNAVKQKQPLNIDFQNKNGKLISVKVLPIRIEYSEKDDKMRLICINNGKMNVINIVKVKTVKRCNDDKVKFSCKSIEDEQAVFELIDERNALERCLLHFAHLKKQVQRLSKNKYIVTIWYSIFDETEILIRLLSFGPFIKVISSKSLVDSIKMRLNKQKIISNKKKL